MSRAAEQQEQRTCQRQQSFSGGSGGGGGGTAASTEPKGDDEHADEGFRCDDCNKTYASKGSLKTHLASKKHAGNVEKRQPVGREDAATARVVRLAAVGDVAAVLAVIKHRQLRGQADLNRPIPRPPSPVTPQLSPLMAAAAGNHLEVARVLLDAGANPNQAEAGWTAVMWAAQRGHREMVELLADRGAQLARLSEPTTYSTPEEQRLMFVMREPRRDGFPVLVCAAQGGHLELVRALLERTGYAVLTAEQQAEGVGGDVFGEIHGRTPMHHAIVNGDVAMVRLLRRYGACDEAKTWEHWEPSHHRYDKVRGHPPFEVAATADHVMNEDLSYDKDDDDSPESDDDTIGGPHYKPHRGSNRRPPRRRLPPHHLAAALGQLDILKLFCEESRVGDRMEGGPYEWGNPRKSPMVCDFWAQFPPF